jgi:hypothetical protein
MVQKSLDQQTLYPFQKWQKNFKNIKFDLQGYFDMKMMFNGFDRLFELSNLRYGCEAQEILYFTKHHSLTIYREREV